MNKNLADITIVVDKSGSMHSVRSDAEGGINSFLSDQAKQDGSANITLVEFSTDWRFVYHAAPVSSSMRYTLSPSGGTALLDAVGNAINDTGRRLAAMKEKDRPGVVTFVIVTDGQENSSREFTRAKIKEMIEHSSAFTTGSLCSLAQTRTHSLRPQALESTCLVLRSTRTITRTAHIIWHPAR